MGTWSVGGSAGAGAASWARLGQPAMPIMAAAAPWRATTPMTCAGSAAMTCATCSWEAPARAAAASSTSSRLAASSSSSGAQAPPTAFTKANRSAWFSLCKRSTASFDEGCDGDSAASICRSRSFCSRSSPFSLVRKTTLRCSSSMRSFFRRRLSCAAFRFNSNRFRRLLSNSSCAAPSPPVCACCACVASPFSLSSSSSSSSSSFCWSSSSSSSWFFVVAPLACVSASLMSRLVVVGLLVSCAAPCGQRASCTTAFG
mmetsp:Transcript_14526/g.44027  ORF Transcript_14526/g.44027 Transcript_14526/m.44027 type:complete len:258 (-) Transcript_14526:24-797(-)